MKRIAVMEAYRPFGTASCVAIGVTHRGKTLVTVNGPAADREHSLRTAKSWALNRGFTHYRMFGERAVQELEAPK